MGKRIDFRKALFYIVLFVGSFVLGIILTEVPDMNIATETVVYDGDVSYIPSGEEMIDGKVNINAATAEALQQLSGIGEKLSQRIVEYRTDNGEFVTIENIMDVPGIGYEKFKNIEADICTGK